MRAWAISGAVVVGVFFLPVTARAGKVGVGAPAPAFRLETLDGQRVDLERLKGRSAVFVVARSRRAAKRCRQWVLALDERLGQRAALYQVIVVLKPWYLPQFAVRNKIESLIPKRYHRNVLLEWRDRFARQFGIPKDGTPTVLLIGPGGTLRWKHRGSFSEAAWHQVEAALPAPPKQVASRR